MTPPDKSMDADERSRDHVTSLERGLAVLEVQRDGFRVVDPAPATFSPALN